MQQNSKIYIAGHSGLVGSAIKRKLESKGYTNIIGLTHQQLNLTNQTAVANFFDTEKPEYIFFAAAKVGGIVANNTYRGQFIYENLQIQNNIIHWAYTSGVKKLLFLGSSCIYPKNAPQPITENSLLTSELEYTNEPYAIAKIAGIKMCESYNLQYGTNFISVMPTNLYGPNDNYDLEKSHVLPALIRKMHLGKCLIENNWLAIKADLNRLPIEGITGKAQQTDIINILSKYGITQSKNNTVSVTLWGTGNPLREFLHSDDMADASVFIMENINFSNLIPVNNAPVINTHINIGSGTDLTISNLALIIKEVTQYTGNLIWDSTKPDGTFRKLMDSSKLNKLGWKPKIEIKEGIKQVYNLYTAQELM